MMVLSVILISAGWAASRCLGANCPGKMKLVDNVVRSMRVAKLYNDNQEQITNFHYSNDGMNIISSSADDQIIIYDCEKGTQKFTLNSKKYGVDLIHFTQNKNHAVHASTKENDIIRYMSLKENKYWNL